MVVLKMFLKSICVLAKTGFLLFGPQLAFFGFKMIMAPTYFFGVSYYLLNTSIGSFCNLMAGYSK